MRQSVFDEVEHWLEFIRVWERENDGKIPNEALMALENALEKAIAYYREQNEVNFESEYLH